MFRSAFCLLALCWAGVGWCAEPLRVPLQTQAQAHLLGWKPYERHLEFEEEPPPGEWTLPEFNGSRPLFARIELADGPRLLALDHSSDQAKVHDRLICIAGGGQPAAPVAGEIQSQRFFLHVEFPIRFQVAQGPQSEEFQCNLSLMKFGDDEEHYYATISPAQHLAGEWTQADRSWTVKVGDGDFNGLLGEPCEGFDCTDDDPHALLEPHGDRLLLAPGGRGVHDVPLGRWLLIEGQLHKLAIERDGTSRTMVLTPVEESSLVAFELGEGFQQVALLGEEGQGVLAMVRPPAQPKIPAGRWRLLEYAVSRVDGRGRPWILAAEASRAGAPFKVGVAEPVPPIAEAFTPMAVIEFVNKDQQGKIEAVELGYQLVGNQGEVVSTVKQRGGGLGAILGGGWSDPPTPSYRIVTADGELVSQGQFEYG